MEIRGENISLDILTVLMNLYIIFYRQAGGFETPPVTQVDRSARNSMRTARTNSQRSVNTASTRVSEELGLKLIKCRLANYF